MMLVVGAADFLVKNPTKTSLVHALSFYKAAKLVLMDLREPYTRHSLIEHVLFRLLMAVDG